MVSSHKEGTHRSTDNLRQSWSVNGGRRRGEQPLPRDVVVVVPHILEIGHNAKRPSNAPVARARKPSPWRARARARPGRRAASSDRWILVPRGLRRCGDAIGRKLVVISPAWRCRRTRRPSLPSAASSPTSREQRSCRNLCALRCSRPAKGATTLLPVRICLRRAAGALSVSSHAVIENTSHCAHACDRVCATATSPQTRPR